MKKLIAIPVGVDVPYDLSNDVVIRVPILDDDDKFIIIAKCGLAIEDFLLKNGRTALYSTTTEYQLAGIIWKVPECDFVDTNVPWIQNMRGDELLFPSLYFYTSGCWVVGHIRALVKFAAACVHLHTPNLRPMYKFDDKSQMIWLLWLASRIGLKVYGKTVANI